MLGAASDAARTGESQKLLNYGFQAFDTVQLYASGKPVSTLRVWKGAAAEVAAGFLADQYLTLPKGQAAKLELTLTASEPLLAPIVRGQKVGTVKVVLEGRTLGEFPLLALVRRTARQHLRPRLGHGAAVVQMSDPSAERRAMIVYLNGQYLPIEEARIPVLDRGFIYGDGVYELVPVYRRKPFRMREHLAAPAAQPRRHPARESAHDRRSGRAIIGTLIDRHDFDDQAIYFQVTRGVAKRDHAFPQGVAPTVFVMSNPLPTPSPAQFADGVAVVTAEDNRWHRCDLKTISLVGNVLMRQLAADAGAIETVMFRDGFLTEASASNVLTVQGRADRRAAEGQPHPARDHLRRGRGFRPRRGDPVRHPADPARRSVRRRRVVAVVVDQGSAGDHDGRRPAVRRRQAGARVPAHARAVQGRHRPRLGGRRRASGRAEAPAVERQHRRGGVRVPEGLHLADEEHVIARRGDAVVAALEPRAAALDQRCAAGTDAEGHAGEAVGQRIGKAFGERPAAPG